MPRGVGRKIELTTKGWLPYVLRWSFRVNEFQRPERLSLEAIGDFNGRGIWTFRQDGPRGAITYDGRVAAEKPLRRRLSFLLKLMCAANHRWAMRLGDRSLKLELACGQARPPEEPARAPAPPRPTPSSGLEFRVKLPFLPARL